MLFRRLFTSFLLAPLLVLAAPDTAPDAAPPAKAEQPAPSVAAKPRDLKPSQGLSLELKGLIRLLEEVHFNRDQVKPSSYAEVIPNTFKALDGQRLFLLASDLAEFQARHPAESLYWNLATLGRLEPAFAI
ncbi:MAG: tail-specific protease, partial [Burkholderiales bacterium]|nr:tail-specific protease [Opitutaceae bacterium]